MTPITGKQAQAGSVEAQSVHFSWVSSCWGWLTKFSLMSLFSHFPPCPTHWWQGTLTEGGRGPFSPLSLVSFSWRLKNRNQINGTTLDDEIWVDVLPSPWPVPGCPLGTSWGRLGRTWAGRFGQSGQGRRCSPSQSEHNTYTPAPHTRTTAWLTFIGGFCALKFWWEKWLCSPPPFWQATQTSQLGIDSPTEAVADTNATVHI